MIEFAVSDDHIRGQRRSIEARRFNECFLIHASTSPFYPLSASPSKLTLLTPGGDHRVAFRVVRAAMPRGVRIERDQSTHLKC
jgi:hypothetical protein